MIPIDRADNHYPVGSRTVRIDFRYPVTHLAMAWFGITGARPVAQRHRRRDACLARVNNASVL